MSDFPAPPAGSMPAGQAGPRKIEKEEAKEMIAEMSAIVEDEANAGKIEAMKEQLTSVGDNIMLFMTTILPGFIELCGPVLSKHGLPADPFGAMAAFQSMRPLMEDDEVREAATKLRETLFTDELFEVLKNLAAMSGMM